MGNRGSSYEKVDMAFRDIPDTLNDGTEVKMGQFAGSVLYITNVASK